MNSLKAIITGSVFALALAAETPQWKDGQAEWNMFNAAKNETDAKKMLALVNAWKEKYPDSEFKLVRAGLFAKDYLALNQPAQAVKASQEALANLAKDVIRRKTTKEAFKLTLRALGEDKPEILCARMIEGFDSRLHSVYEKLQWKLIYRPIRYPD